MKKKLKITILTSLSCIVLPGLIVCVVVHFPDTKGIREFDNKFSLIQIGDSEMKVFSVLGEPNSKVYEFRLGQMIGVEKTYGRAKAGDAEYYLFWFRGIDYVFTVGINSKGRVCAKESGGT